MVHELGEMHMKTLFERAFPPIDEQALASLAKKFHSPPHIVAMVRASLTPPPRTHKAIDTSPQRRACTDTPLPDDETFERFNELYGAYRCRHKPELPGLDLEFENFLKNHLKTTNKHEALAIDIALVARQVYYGAHFDHLFPQPNDTWCTEDEEAKRPQLASFRISSEALNEGQDIVISFDTSHPDRRRRYLIMADG